MHPLRVVNGVGPPLQKPFLHSNAIVYLFRPAETVPAKSSEEDDRDRGLSAEGVMRSKKLGVVIDVHLRFDQVITAATKRAQRTAHEALVSRYGGVPWYRGKERELYGPAEENHFKALLAIEREIKSRRAIHQVIDDEALRLRTDFLLDRFKQETREVVRSIPSISERLSIAIFSDPVIGNAVAAALFPQHAAALETIEVAPCDCIKLSRIVCQHFRAFP